MFQEPGDPVSRVIHPCFLYSQGCPQGLSQPSVGLQTAIQIAKNVFFSPFPPCVLLAVGVGDAPRSGAVGEG